MNEEEEIQNKIFPYKECPVCNTMGNIKLTGMAFYTSPLIYEWKCKNCNTTGETGFVGIPTIYIPEENKKQYDIESKGITDINELRKLSKKYGKYEDRKLFFNVNI